MMDRKKQAVDVEDGLSSIKIGVYTLIRLGLPLEDIVEKINGVIKEVVQSEDITLLSEDVSGLVSDRHITRLGDIKFDGFRRVVTYKGHKADLSPSSAVLMSLFMSKPGVTVTHQEIVERVYPEEKIEGKPSVMCRTIIHRLREYLSDLPGGEEWIETVRGTGYVFVGGEKTNL
ncbi:MAG: winged helix-turn-helix domain-containing protein [Anaerolineales bacterium]